MTRRIAVSAIAVCFLFTFLVVDFFNTEANSSILSDFQTAYGGGLVAKFGCEICHLSGTTTLNDYGRDLSEAVGFGCQDFNPPSSHNIVEQRGTCEASHAPGYEMPMASNCVGCHGKNLGGDNAPSCYTCHGKLWQDGGSGSCPDFNAPGDHTKYKSEHGCGAYHKDGYEHPVSSGCTACHGGNLRGGTGPSCYTCHGNEWDDDDDDAPPSAPASVHPGLKASDFRTVENKDSDGDGYTNKEEIDALTNPGDSNSYPLGENSFTVKMPTEWERSWLENRGEIGIRITSKNGIAIDDSKPITLTVGKNSLTTTKIKMRKGGTAEARFQKSLLFCLFAGTNGKNMTLSIDGMLVDGTEFSLSGDIKLVGSSPDQLTGLRMKSTPKKLEDGTDLQLKILGKDSGDVDIDSKLTAIGVYRQLKINDVKRVGSDVVIDIPARDVERLFGTLDPDVTYTLGVRGSGDDDSVFCVTANLNVASSGGGGGGGGGGGQDQCLDFSPPSSHTQKRTSGNCTYLHMPGASNPTANGCTACHGSDLKGSSFAPSCLLCHGVKW